MSDKSKKWTWMIVGAGVVAGVVLPQRSMAQCNSYTNTYATQPVRIDYGPAYRGPAAHATVARSVEVSHARSYAQPASHVQRVVYTAPAYAPVQHIAPVVVYADGGHNYRRPARRVYSSGHSSRRYVPSVSHGYRTRSHRGLRRAIGHRSRSSRGHRGFSAGISAGRGHGGVSFSYGR